MTRVRANSEKIRTIFERICIELCRFMQNSRNANMVERENGFRLQKCCPCRTDGVWYPRLFHYLYICATSLFITLWCVFLLFLFIYFKPKTNNGCIFYLNICIVYLSSVFGRHCVFTLSSWVHQRHLPPINTNCIYNILLIGHILTFVLLF